MSSNRNIQGCPFNTYVSKVSKYSIFLGYKISVILSPYFGSEYISKSMISACCVSSNIEFVRITSVTQELREELLSFSINKAFCVEILKVKIGLG